MASNPLIIQRLMKSYQLMLDFYGMRLVSHETGLVDRCLPPRNYRSRYRNLVRKSLVQQSESKAMFNGLN